MERYIDLSDDEIVGHRNPNHDSVQCTVSIGTLNIELHEHTHADTSNIYPCPIQYGHHMPTFRDRTLETWIEGIATEARDEIRETVEIRTATIVIDESLKSGNATYWLCRSFSMILGL